jgi:dihydrofolate synthase/folylpolyglutamate synthase
VPGQRLSRALSRLYGRASRGIQLGLGPMMAACARFDHPERAFRAVHVTGTNGKGSVCAMVQEVAMRAGIATGMYTSPHLVRFAERIRIGGEPIGDELLVGILEDIDARAPELTFFEATTLAAFLAFRAVGIELAVVEVGIGGRLDATNVLPSPLVTAITRVALDHTEYLGETAELIAREKAGIAKPGAPLVLGPLEPDIEAVISHVAQAHGARVVSSAEPEESNGKADPSYQRDNRGVATRIARELQATYPSITDTILREGVAAARWPGRLERVEARGVHWLLDAAHNPDGAQALIRSLDGPAAALVFGTLADKKWPQMLEAVATLVPDPLHRFYAPPSSGIAARPAAPPQMLADCYGGVATPSVAEALERAAAVAAVASGGTVLVCGSIFLLGEARALLLDLPRDPPLAL